MQENSFTPLAFLPVQDIYMNVGRLIAPVNGQ